MTGTRASCCTRAIEALAAARHDHVDAVGHAGEHVADGGAIGRRHQLDAGLRQARGAQARDQAGVDRGARVVALAAAAQDRRVAGLEAQRAGVAGHVRPALVDDADDAERHAHALDPQAVRARPLRDHRADRIRQRRDLLDARAPSPRRARRRAAAGRAPRARVRRRSAALMSRALAARISGLARAQRRRGIACSARLRCCAARARAARAAPRPRRGRAAASVACDGCRRSSRQHQVVAVDHLVAAAIPENRLELLAAAAAHARAHPRSSRRSGRARSRRRPRRAPRTASPRSKRPSTRVTPAGSRLLPPRSARPRPRRRAARPPACSMPAIHCLRTVTGEACGHEPGAARAGLDAPQRMRARDRSRRTCGSRPRRAILRGEHLGRHAAGADVGRRAARHRLDLGRDAA